MMNWFKAEDSHENETPTESTTDSSDSSHLELVTPNQEEETMFNEKSEALKLADVSREVSTVLDKECTFEGKMTFEGSVIINGKFKGEIFSEGSLIIGEGGHVEGQIEIGRIEIQGQVIGNIKAKEKIEINAPAEVRGDISAPSLIIKEGAIFEGNCAMGQRREHKTVNVLDMTDHQAGE